jgi:hypothetical protein
MSVIAVLQKVDETGKPVHEVDVQRAVRLRR